MHHEYLSYQPKKLNKLQESYLIQIFYLIDNNDLISLERLFNFFPTISLEDMVNIQDADGWSPLILAAYKGFPNITNFLLKRGANKNLKLIKKNMNALAIAIEESKSYQAKEKALEYQQTIDLLK